MNHLLDILNRHGIRDMTFVDVGAKDALEYSSDLAPLIHCHGFEPNPEEYKKLEERYKNHPFKALHLNHVGLSDADGEAAFRITMHASMSSLLEPDPENYARHFGAYKEYTHWGNSIQEDKTIGISIQRTDSYFEKHPSSVDYMKLDTQGSELQILHGAQNMLASRKIYVLKVEVSTVPIYKGQALFSDVDQFLRNHHYTLVDYTTYRNDQIPLFRSKSGQSYYGPCGDAVYVLNDHKDTAEVRIRKSLVLFWLGYDGLANHILKDAGLSTQEIKAIQNIRSKRYMPFYRRLIKNLTPPALYRFIKKMQ